MSLKILLADDSMTAQNMGKKILTDAGYEVIAVSNGAAAVKKIAEHKPDVAILDIYMPGYTGLEVCERVKGTLETSRMPVLLTVGKMEPYRVEDGARVRSDGVIVKPFEATDLIAAVEKLAQKVSSAKPAWKRESDEGSTDPSEIETSSFQALKSDDSLEDTAPERFTVAQELQATPAMDFASIGIEPVEHEIVSAAEMAISAPMQFPEPEFVAEPSSAPWQPAGFVVEEPDSVDKNDEPMFASESSHDPALELPEIIDDSNETSAGIQAFEVEFNSAPPVGEIEDAAVPELQPDQPESPVEIEPVTEPALLAAQEVATAFPTAFGTEIVTEPTHDDRSAPELASAEIPADNADAEPSDEFESRVAAAMAAYERLGIPTPNQQAEPVPTSAWHAEPVEVDPEEATASLESELAGHFPGMKFNSAAEFGPVPSLDSAAVQQTTSLMLAEAAAPAIAAAPTFVHEAESEVDPLPEAVSQPDTPTEVMIAPAPEPVSSPEPEPHHSSAFAAVAAATLSAFAAAPEQHIAASDEAPSDVPSEDDRIAKAIQRVLDRLKPQIVSEIAQELAKKNEN